MTQHSEGRTEIDHDGFTVSGLRALIAACDECECPHDCYCASNREWAERKCAALSKTGETA